MTLLKALFLKDTSPESLFISDGEIEFHLTCHKHPVSWPQNKVNNLAGNCCMPSKQAVKLGNQLASAEVQNSIYCLCAMPNCNNMAQN